MPVAWTIMDKYSEERPWGNFEQFTCNETSTVKLLNVNAGEQLSLQYHHNRDEFWRIISGEAKITIGDEEISGKAGDEFYIPKETNHRIKTEKLPVQILEISLGQFNEDDIVRLDDKYHRELK